MADKPILAYGMKEAAQSCGLGRTTLYRFIEDGSLKSFSIGSRRLILASDLQEFLESHRNVSDSDPDLWGSRAIRYLRKRRPA